MDIDLTKYYIKRSSHRNDGSCWKSESAAHLNSASFPAHNSSHPDEQASVRQRCISDSAPDVFAPYDSHACNNSYADSRFRSSSHLQIWQSGGRGHAAVGPPTSRRTTQSTEANIAASDLNLTNSMTDLIQSGSTSSHAWPLISTSVTNLAPAGGRKPPTGGHQVRPMKRRTKHLQSHDREISPPSMCNNRPLRWPMSVDVISRPDTTPLKGPALPVDMNWNRFRSASTSAFSPPGGVEEHLSPTLLERAISTDVIAKPPVIVVYDASKTSKHGGNWNHVSPASYCARGGMELPVESDILTTPTTAVAEAARKKRLVVQEGRGCISNTDVRFTGLSSLATNMSQDGGQDIPIKLGLRSQPRPHVGLNPISKKPKGILRGKTVSLVDVTFGPQISNSGAAKSGFPVGDAASSAQYPCDVINRAVGVDTAVGVAGSHESLSDEGYQTKDSGSTLSLNRVQFGVIGQGPLLSAYL